MEQQTSFKGKGKGEDRTQDEGDDEGGEEDEPNWYSW